MRQTKPTTMKKKEGEAACELRGTSETVQRRHAVDMDAAAPAAAALLDGGARTHPACCRDLTACHAGEVVLASRLGR